jgi:hypothetical protein
MSRRQQYEAELEMELHLERRERILTAVVPQGRRDSLCLSHKESPETEVHRS